MPIAQAVIFAIVPVAVASVLGSAVTVPEIPGWYAGLVKPPFNPPNWLFAPVWTALYALMAFAVFRILRLPAGLAGRREAFIAYHVQLALNMLWSCAFFGLRNTTAGLVVILLLLAAILVTIRLFRRLDRFASGLLWPYFAWVAFAALLNLSIWWLNLPVTDD